MLTQEEINNLKSLIHNHGTNNIELGLLLDQEQNEGRYTKELKTRYENILYYYKGGLIELLCTKKIALEQKTICGHVDLSGLVNLQEVYLSYNFINSIVLDNLPKLQFIEIGKNNIKELTIKNLPNLLGVSANGGTLEKVRIDKTPKLVRLLLEKNKLKEFYLKDCKRLITLDLEHNKLKKIDLINLCNLDSLYVRDNKLKKIDLSKIDLHKKNQLKEFILKDSFTKIAF